MEKCSRCVKRNQETYDEGFGRICEECIQLSSHGEFEIIFSYCGVEPMYKKTVENKKPRRKKPVKHSRLLLALLGIITCIFLLNGKLGVLSSIVFISSFLIFLSSFPSWDKNITAIGLKKTAILRY